MMPKSRSAFWDNNFSTLLLLVLDIAKDASLSESRLQVDYIIYSRFNIRFHRRLRL